MRNSTGNDFLSRLDRLSAGRDVTPWLKGLGFTAGTITRIKQGQTPSTDFLAALQRFENARVDWLISGRGTPYLITYCDGEAGCLLHLAQLLEDEPGWKIHVVADAYSYVFVLTQPATHAIGDKSPIPYTALEVVAGGSPLTGIPLDLLEKSWFLSVGSDVMEQLQEGRLGTYQLVGDDRRQGILEQAVRLPAGQQAGLAEEPGAYRRHVDLHRLVDELNPQQARAMESFLQASVHTAPMVAMLNAEPMFYGTDYVSPHGSDATGATAQDDNDHDTHRQLPKREGRTEG